MTKTLPWIAVALGLLSGCGTTPANRYFTLSAVAPAAAPSALSGPSGPSGSGGLTVAAVRLPGVLNRPQLVVRTGPQTVDVREYDRWAEPIDDMTTRILAQDLAMRRGPQRGGADRRLFVVIDDFMAGDGAARLTGRWWTLAADEESGRKREHTVALSRPVDANDSAQVAAAMSALIAALADAAAAGG